jgi:hypothetical protein
MVGNWGHLTQCQSHISKTPHLHNLNLENHALSKAYRSQRFQNYFHFSCVNYGYYYLFLISYLLFHYPPEPVIHLVQLAIPATKITR